MLEFANPLMLAGLAAASIPILIHLLFRRRIRRTPWAAMALLRQAVEPRRRRIMLHNLLLLALRVLAVILLVLMFARPFAASRLPLLAAVGKGETALVVLLDDSASMAQRAGDASAFERASEVVLSMAEGLVESGARASLTVHLASRREAVFHSARLRFEEIGRLRSVLDGLSPTALALGAERALTALAEHARHVTAAGVLICILTDVRRQDWAEQEEAGRLRESLARALRELQRLGRVVVVDTALAEDDNVGLAAPQCTEPLVHADLPALCTVGLHNRSSQEVPGGRLDVLVDGLSLPPVRTPSVPPGALREVAASLSLGAGFHGLEFRFEFEDALPPDNRAYLALESHENVRALVIEGAPGARPSLDASYYLRTALHPDPGSGGGIEVDVRPPWALPEISLSEYAAVFLCNVEDPGSPAVLGRYVREGGGLVIFLGDRVNKALWNGSLLDPERGVLPGRLTGAMDMPAEPAPRGFASIEFGNRFLAPFQPWESLFRMIRVTRLWGFEPLADTQVLARCGDGQAYPVLLYREHGRGAALLVTTTAGAEWNDWARSETGRITYVAFLHHAVEQMARVRELQLNLDPGSPLEMRLDLSRYEQTALLHEPASAPGRQVVPRRLRAGPREGEEGLWLVSEPLRRAGLWRLELTRLTGGTETVNFAVNTAPEEGDLERLPAAAFRAAAVSGDSLRVLSYDEVRSADVHTAGRQYWQFLAALLLTVLLLESALASLPGAPRASAPGRRLRR